MVLHIIRSCDVNAYDKSGWTPLLRAAYLGDVEVARQLIRANADVHLKVRGSGRSVLYTAVYYVCQAWVKFYLLVMFILRVDEQAAGEVVRAKADYYGKVKGSGRTALHIAAYYGHQSLVKLFLETEVNINEQDDEGRTALMLAVERGHRVRVVAELVKAGADVSLKDKKGMTAVQLAKGYDMVEQLVREVGDLSREDRSRILWHACDFGDLSMVRSVIEAGCDVDHIHKGQTPVMMATLRGHDSIVKELILANCDVQIRGSVLYRDMANTLNLARLIRAKRFYWIATVVCVLLPWMKATLWVDPVWGSLVLLVMSVLAVVGILLMPGSRTMMLLGSWTVAIALIVALTVTMVAGPVVAVLSVVIPLGIRGPKATVVAVIREVVGSILLATLMVFAILGMLLLVPVILVWSPQGLVTTREAGAVFLIFVAVILTIVMLMKKMLLAQWDLALAVLEGVIVNVELFVIASSCMMIGRKSFVFTESHTAQGIADLLMTVMIFIWFLLMVLRTHAAEMAVYRGAAGFVVFESTKLLKMEDLLVSLDKLHLALMVVVTVRLLAGMLSIVTKRTVLLKGVVVVLHLMVAVAEAYLALVISKKGEKLLIATVNMRDFVNLTTVLVMVLSVEGANDAALHYAASYNRIKCGVLLVEAGADVRAKNRHRCTPMEIGSKTFVGEVQKALSFTTKRVIAVIGNTEHGKSTLVAALECTSDILWKKAINHFKKVHDIRQRTAGIEAVQVSNPKYGEALFYDFAGQSQYHGPHQSFLEAMLSKPEVSVTLLLLVKATDEEDIITQQLHRWLQPLALISTPVTAKVLVVCSFLDQVKSKKEASEKLLRCTQSVKIELPLDIQGPCLLDCRQPESKGINQICRFLQEAHPVNTKALSYNLHWVLVQLQKAFSVPALHLLEFQTWLQDNARNLPRNLPSPEEVCQDLSTAGHTLFLPNKQDPSQSWLILDLPALLYNVYGTLFSGSPVEHNQFGLLHCSKLTKLFPRVAPEMIREVLKALEFCIEIDPLLLKEEVSRLIGPEDRGWLYFPALVSASRPINVLPDDPPPHCLKWMCWQLRTDYPEKHFISAHLLQAIILRLAVRHVFIEQISPSKKWYCCSVWVNGISWSSTKGVDIAVQISDSSVVLVVGHVCSMAGALTLQKYTAAVVQDVIKTISQLSPKLEATPYIIHPYTPILWEDPKAAQPISMYPVSIINSHLSHGDDHASSLAPNTASIPIAWLFGGELPLLTTVQDLNYASVARNVVRPGTGEQPRVWQSVLEVVPRDSHSSWLTTITITGERVTEEIKRESIPDAKGQVLHNTLPDEALLQQLCCMATDIKCIRVGCDGGTFTLGRGDASLKFPPEAVVKKTLVRYAIILNGPFVLPTGCKLTSVVVYLNMDGATLVKPVQLTLSHWSSREKGGDDSLHFLQASHTLEAGQREYVFEKQDEGDFASHSDRGVLSISEPRCLHCVETKIDTIARYSAITFSRYIPTQDTLFFRIQIMCDSLEWNEMVTNTLLQREERERWEKCSSAVTRFQYDQQQITARPEQSSGPGWLAAIDGQQSIEAELFLLPVALSSKDLQKQITSGRYPPCILYKIVYTGAKENRVKAALMNVHVDGANKPLHFCCRVEEERIPTPPGSRASSEASHSGNPQLTSSTDEGTPYTVSEILLKHEKEFFKVVNPKFSLMRLERKRVITPDVASRINAATTEEDAQEILFDHLQRNASVGTLREYCEVAISANGLPNMQSFGEKLKEELQGAAR